MTDPQPGQFWASPKGRIVEILARSTDDDTVAYKFLGGSMIRLRAARSLTGWTKVEFE